MLPILEFLKSGETLFCMFPQRRRIYDFSFPEPCNSDVALEDILLSPKSSTLEGLYINRDDLRLSATIDHRERTGVYEQELWEKAVRVNEFTVARVMR